MTRHRKIAAAVVSAALTVLTAAALFAHPVLETGIAYKAKMLCSEIFVAGREPADVLADLESHKLKGLRIVGTSFDRVSRIVTARAPLGIIQRQASFRARAGCALMFDEQPSTAGSAESFSEPNSSSISRSIGNDPFQLTSDAAQAARLVPVLDDAFSEPDPQRPRRTRAVIVISNGHVIAERYARGFTADTPMQGWSMTKSVLNALVGILVGQGRMALENPLPIAAWRPAGDPRGPITLDQLLRMSSGLRFDEDMTKPVTDVTTMLFRVPDMAAFVAGKPADAAPGTRWQYSSGTSLIVSRWMRDILGGEYARFPRTALFDRIGISGAVLETDASGTFAASSFMYATARDWARLGVLYLQDGTWNGARILPDGWVAYTRTPAPADATRSYGAHFWLQVPAEFRGSSSGLPNDAFHAAGHEGQFVTIVPSRETVIVRLGKTRDPRSWDHEAFVRKILDALQK